MNTSRVILPRLVHSEIMHYVNSSNFEVSGLGKVERRDGDLVVTGVMLFPQKNRSTHTEMDTHAICKAMYELRGQPGDLWFWWHSHVNMPAFMSAEDWDTIKNYALGGVCIASVFNKKNESKTVIAITSPFSMLVEDAKLCIEDSIPAELVAQWEKNYANNVTNVTYEPPTYAGDYYTREYGVGQAVPLAKLSKKDRKRLRRSQCEREEALASAAASDDGMQVGGLSEQDWPRVSDDWWCVSCKEHEDDCRCLYPDLIHADQLQDWITNEKAVSRQGAPKGPPASLNGSTEGVY